MSKTKRGKSQQPTTATAKTTTTSAKTTAATETVEPQAVKVSGRAQRKLAEEEASKKRIWYAAAAVAGIVAVGLLIAWLVSSNDDDNNFPAIVPGNLYPLSPDIPQEGNMVGAEDAAVTLVEWGDYQCPACGNFAKSAGPNLVNEYINTGLIKFQFRDFPFIGAESEDAAEAATCAMDQGKFWDYHDTIYVNQQGENQGAFSKERLIEMAAVNEMDTEAFENCLDENTHEQAVQDSRQEGVDLGVTQTPTLIINGEMNFYRGWDDLKVLLDTALAGTEQE